MHLDAILDESARSVLCALSRSRLPGRFYLAGGTGLALQLGHRRSLDLDFLQDSALERLPLEPLVDHMDRVFGRGRARLTLKQEDQATWEVHGTKVTFLAYPFRLLAPPLSAGTLFPELGDVPLAGPRDIACMKAYALGRRSTFRDYIDLYFLLSRGLVTLDQVIEDSTVKFVVGGESVFSAKLFLEQLAYTDDVDDKDVSMGMVLGTPLTVDQVESFLDDQVRRFLAKADA